MDSRRANLTARLIVVMVFFCLFAGVGWWVVRWAMTGDASRAIVLHDAPPMLPGDQIGGLVQDENGLAIPGVRVRLDWSIQAPNTTGSRLSQTKELLTDAQGRWTLPGFPHDSVGHLRLHLTHPDYATQTLQPAARPLLDGALIAVLNRNRDLTGVVIDTAGHPVADAEVTTKIAPFDTAGVTATTDADGRFRLRRVAAQTVTLTVTAKGYGPSRQNLTVKKDSDPVKFVLSPGKTLRGRVVDADGKPITKADVDVYLWNDYRTQRFQGQTNVQGEFAMPDAPAGEIDCSVGKEGYQGAESVVMVSDAPALFTLRPSWTVSGTVLDADTHKPIPKFNAIQGVQPSGYVAPYFWFTQPLAAHNGHYRLELRGFTDDPAPRFVRIEAPGYVPAILRAVPGSAVMPDIPLQRGEDIRGRVLAPDGRPAAAVTVALVQPAQMMHFTNGEPEPPVWANVPATKTDADGHFSFPPQTGQIELWAVGDAGCAQVRHDAVFTSPPQLPLIPWGSVVLRGLHWDVKLATAEITPAAHPFQQSFTRWTSSMSANANGDITLDHLPVWPEEMAHIRIYREMPQPGLELTVHLTPGKPTALDLSRGVSLTGRVITTPGGGLVPLRAGETSLRPVIDLSPTVWPQDWLHAARLAPPVLSYDATADSRGKFRIEGVPPGNYIYSALLVSSDNLIWRAAKAVRIDAGTADLGDLLCKLRPFRAVGDAAPALLGRTFSGGDLKLDSFAGKYVVWMAWDSYTATTVHDLPGVAELGEKFAADRRVALVGINVDAVRSALPRRPPPLGAGWIDGYLSLLDQNDTDPMDGSQWPTILLIGPDGKVAATDLTAEQTAPLLTRLLAGGK